MLAALYMYASLSFIVYTRPKRTKSNDGPIPQMSRFGFTSNFLALRPVESTYLEIKELSRPGLRFPEEWQAGMIVSRSSIERVSNAHFQVHFDGSTISLSLSTSRSLSFDRKTRYNIEFMLVASRRRVRRQWWTARCGARMARRRRHSS